MTDPQNGVGTLTDPRGQGFLKTGTADCLTGGNSRHKQNSYIMPQQQPVRQCFRSTVFVKGVFIYTSLFARKAAATSEKKHQTHNNKNKQTKEKKNYAQIGRASEHCYQIYTPTNSKNIC